MQIFYFSYDYLYVYDGTILNTQLAALTGNPDNLATLTTISTNSSMTLNFKTDSSGGRRGFVLKYEAACKSNIVFVNEIIPLQIILNKFCTRNPP